MTPPPEDAQVPEIEVPEIDEAEAAVNAVLDGEATPDQQRLVARDPALRARLEKLREVSATIGAEPEPAAATALDAVRAKALAALDSPQPDEQPEADAGTGDGRPPQQAPPDDAVRPLRARPPRRLPPLPAVAAVVVLLLALGVGLILTDRGDPEHGATFVSDTPSAAGSERDERTGDAGEERSPAEASEGSPKSNELALDRSGAPEFTDEDALRTALQGVDPTTLADLGPPSDASGGGGAEGAADATAFAADPAVQRCASVVQASDRDIGPVQAAALVVVDGEELLVLSHPVRASTDGAESTRLFVVGALDCIPHFAVQR